MLSLRRRTAVRGLLAAAIIGIAAAGLGLAAVADEEPTAVAICGECDGIELAVWYHEFSGCQQQETHDGDCSCGGGDCHLALVQGKCKGTGGCGHGNCAPEGDDEDLVASLSESGTTTCLSGDQLVGLVEREDTEAIVELAAVFGDAVKVNEARGALQVLNCAGNVSIHVPLPANVLEELTQVPDLAY